MDTIAYAQGWMRAFFDGEGHANVSSPALLLTSTDPELVAMCMAQLHILGISARVYKSSRTPPHQDVYRIKISRRDDIRRFADVVGSSVPRKLKALGELLAWFDRPGQNRRTRWYGPPPPTKEELSSLLAMGLTRREVGDKLGITVNMVTHYARSYGLCKPRRVGPEPPIDAVRAAYWDEGLSLDAVAKRFGYSAKGAILHFFRKHGIPTRPHGVTRKNH